MPEFIKSRKVKVRWMPPKKGYMQVTVPKILADNEIIKEGDELTPVFDSILIYLPKGKKVDTEKLKKAIVEEAEEGRS